ncbi:MAG: hypothetical protein JAY67_17755 [Candidatus Thiodiazotropha taylori]|nr:hypothetical protein [Candidatus Thiodiazotropha taylori]
MKVILWGCSATCKSGRQFSGRFTVYYLCVRIISPAALKKYLTFAFVKVVGLKNSSVELMIIQHRPACVYNEKNSVAGIVY